ncbi:MAG: glutamine-hydrolyzing GMP synthase [Chloroflexi bacterium]|nr:glutamine-hydrolyzing GMP synthase [Chloroflexota bacterium]|tara:strand:+ start:1711 stop:3339 length:1629 start_codon:yes stop_codon:yes gene_type:complete
MTETDNRTNSNSITQTDSTDHNQAPRENSHQSEMVLILDYGSQFSMLITRRIRELNIYSELVPWDVDPVELSYDNIKAIILSGGPASVYDESAPDLPEWVLETDTPILGICYGMQILAQKLGGTVSSADNREYGHALIDTNSGDQKLFKNLPNSLSVWMSHGDQITELPPDFKVIAKSQNAPIAAISDSKDRYGIQFHPEVAHTPQGTDILRNFLFDIAECSGNWTASSFVEDTITEIRNTVGNQKVICALSGGVDSAVAATLVHKAIGDQLTCIFVDNALLRHGEPERVVSTFREHMEINLLHTDAKNQFLENLQEVSDPEQKRKIIGETFIRVFEQESSKLGNIDFIVQGTTYPDVVESASSGSGSTVKIKTHHNVGGLPEDMHFQLIEPLRNLFKDEVRKVGVELGLPEEMVFRQPFPGPGLAIRIIGEVTKEKLDILRKADWIVMDEIKNADIYYDLWQSFAVLTDTKTVGVQGDHRTYGFCIALRCVTAEDAMTADWAKLPYDLLGTISSRIVNEVPEVNRIVYDITSKPPGTIEWE